MTGLNSNEAPPEYKLEALPLELTCSVLAHRVYGDGLRRVKSQFSKYSTMTSLTTVDRALPIAEIFTQNSDDLAAVSSSNRSKLFGWQRNYSL
jgi:hypothetical protein